MAVLASAVPVEPVPDLWSDPACDWAAQCVCCVIHRPGCRQVAFCDRTAHVGRAVCRHAACKDRGDEAGVSSRTFCLEESGERADITSAYKSACRTQVARNTVLNLAATCRQRTAISVALSSL